MGFQRHEIINLDILFCLWNCSGSQRPSVLLLIIMKRFEAYDQDRVSKFHGFSHHTLWTFSNHLLKSLKFWQSCNNIGHRKSFRQPSGTTSIQGKIFQETIFSVPSHYSFKFNMLRSLRFTPSEDLKSKVYRDRYVSTVIFSLHAFRRRKFSWDFK